MATRAAAAYLQTIDSYQKTLKTAAGKPPVNFSHVKAKSYVARNEIIFREIFNLVLSEEAKLVIKICQDHLQTMQYTAELAKKERGREIFLLQTNVLRFFFETAFAKEEVRKLLEVNKSLQKRISELEDELRGSQSATPRLATLSPAVPPPAGSVISEFERLNMNDSPTNISQSATDEDSDREFEDDYKILSAGFPDMIARALMTDDSTCLVNCSQVFAIRVLRSVGDGLTAIHYAALKNRVKILQALLDDGYESAHTVTQAYPIDSDLQQSTLDTPLHFAAANGHLEAVVLLLIYGANVDTANSEGKTPVYEACDGGASAVALLLHLFDSTKTLLNAKVLSTTPLTLLKHNDASLPNDFFLITDRIHELARECLNDFELNIYASLDRCWFAECLQKSGDLKRNSFFLAIQQFINEYSTISPEFSRWEESYRIIFSLAYILSAFIETARRSSESECHMDQSQIHAISQHSDITTLTESDGTLKTKFVDVIKQHITKEYCIGITTKTVTIYIPEPDLGNYERSEEFLLELKGLSLEEYTFELKPFSDDRDLVEEGGRMLQKSRQSSVQAAPSATTVSTALETSTLSFTAEASTSLTAPALSVDNSSLPHLHVSSEISSKPGSLSLLLETKKFIDTPTSMFVLKGLLDKDFMFFRISSYDLPSHIELESTSMLAKGQDRYTGTCALFRSSNNAGSDYYAITNAHVVFGSVVKSGRKLAEIFTADSSSDRDILWNVSPKRKTPFGQLLCAHYESNAFNSNPDLSAVQYLGFPRCDTLSGIAIFRELLPVGTLVVKYGATTGITFGLVAQSILSKTRSQPRQIVIAPLTLFSKVNKTQKPVNFTDEGDSGSIYFALLNVTFQPNTFRVQDCEFAAIALHSYSANHTLGEQLQIRLNTKTLICAAKGVTIRCAFGGWLFDLNSLCFESPLEVAVQSTENCKKLCIDNFNERIQALNANKTQTLLF